jgi:predicted RNA binding protein YcfA (HicA-like mRNA interferase family)
MPKQKKLNAKEAEKLVINHGFELIRIKGSHHIYKNENKRIVIPFHTGQILHPKIISEIYEIIENK